MKSATEAVLGIRKIHRLRAAKSFALAASERAKHEMSFREAKVVLQEAERSLEKNDAQVGSEALVIFSQMGIQRRRVLAKGVRDAENYLSLISHQRRGAEELLSAARRNLADAQAALDVAKHLAQRALQRELSTALYLSETRTLEQWINNRCTKFGHGV